MSDVFVMTNTDKHAMVHSYAQPYRVLVETGLCNRQGATITHAAEFRCYAIDLQRENVTAAREAGVQAFEGDSALLLPQLLARLKEPACFYLDAHCVSEAGEEDTSPLLAELAAILDWPYAEESTVLIDDLRMMGRDGWPSVEDVRRAMRFQVGGGLVISVWHREERDDVMRLTPRG